MLANLRPFIQLTRASRHGRANLADLPGALRARNLTQSSPRLALRVDSKEDANKLSKELSESSNTLPASAEHEHAVISTFDLFSIGGK